VGLFDGFFNVVVEVDFHYFGDAVGILFGELADFSSK
jgi:hypothetical protein